MDKRIILQKIIDNNGSCDYIVAPTLFEIENICQNCPMSKLAKRKDGSGFLSCWDALIPHSMEMSDMLSWDEDVNPIYKQKAIEILQDILMEDMLTGELDGRPNTGTSENP